jgi:hypothetical protein
VRFSVYARLPSAAAYDALLMVAEESFRDPREQAAWFIVDGLRRANALHDQEQTAELNRAAEGAAV